MKLKTIKMIIVYTIISYRYVQRLSLGSLQAGPSGAKLTRGVTCNVHLGRPCQPCILCKQSNLSKYFHPKIWKNRASIDQRRELEPALDIQLDSCICRRCRDDVCELSESGFIPRWRKKSSPHKHCCVPGLLSNTNDGFPVGQLHL